MNTDKFKSIALNAETYKRLREMSDKCFLMSVSMAKTSEFLIERAYNNWKDTGWKEVEFNPYPDFKK
jgi:hypothetical protein|tara:strand:- start:376 stop:576 length:201 start_codon:yes stop_codon:yes gene_type:complete